VAGESDERGIGLGARALATEAIEQVGLALDFLHHCVQIDAGVAAQRRDPVAPVLARAGPQRGGQGMDRHVADIVMATEEKHLPVYTDG
jgi:hypothetical protein